MVKCASCLKNIKKGQWKHRLHHISLIYKYSFQCYLCYIKENPDQIVTESYMEYCERQANFLIEENNKQLLDKNN